MPVPLLIATGGTITEDGDYRIHTFTSSGTFEVTYGSEDAWYLVIGGGGGGGGFGGGGAGGYRTNGTYDHPITVGSYAITVGAGGSGSASGTTRGSNGNSSIFDSITSAGGGGGGAFSDTLADGLAGGSGGGGGTDATTPFTGRPGGAGDTPDVTPDQGFSGGDGFTGGTASGGGGGAGAVGVNGTLNTGGTGGAGASSSITGAAVTRGGGGGGSGVNTIGTGGTGGGGNGSRFNGGSPPPPTAGTANTGGGGGGGYVIAGASGGSGVVIIRYRFQDSDASGRDLSGGLFVATISSSLSPIGLVEMQFGSGTVRFWTGRGELEVDGETYTGTGTLGKISSIEETTELRPVTVDFELSGIPPEVLEIANGEDWQGRDVIVKYAALQQTGNRLTLVDDPFQVFKGEMDVMTLVDGTESTVIISAESKQIDLERTSPRRYTAEDQRAAFPDDAGCDAVAGLQEKEIRWGGA